MKVKIFDEDLGKFIYSLERPTIAKVLRTVDLLETFGNKLAMPHSKKVMGRIFELRIRGAQEVRLFYVFQKSEAIILTGFVKKTSKTPRDEIERALSKLLLLDSI